MGVPLRKTGNCWDGNDNPKDNSDAAAAAWITLSTSELPGICYTVAD